MRRKIRFQFERLLCITLCMGMLLGSLTVPEYELKAQTESGSGTVDEGEDVVQNGGFEEPEVTGGNYNSGPMKGWKTTATDQKIEYFKANTQYIPGSNWLRPDEGAQGAELNANEESTLYQNLHTKENSVYEWGLSHRGREGLDTMALIIGPKQQYDPSKPSKTGRDQFMQMVDWLKANEAALEQGAYTKNIEGVGQKITVYSRPFDQNGTFAGNTGDYFNLRQSADYTEEWNVWIIASGNHAGTDDWHKCGYNDYRKNHTMPTTFGGETLDFHYSVPKGQTETTIAFVSVQTPGNKPSFGNLLDNIQFRLFEPMTIRATSSGTATVTVPEDCTEAGENSTIQVDSTAPKTFTMLKGAEITLQAAPESDKDFLGAYINDQFIPKTQFTTNENGTYTYPYVVTGAASVWFVFTKVSTVTYETNGGSWEGTVEENDGDFTTSDSTKFNPENGGIYERNGKLPTCANADFRGWWIVTYPDEKILVPKDHSIAYQGSEAEGSEETFTVSYMDDSGNSVSKTIPAKDGLKFVAQWDYRQTVIPEYRIAEGESYTQGTTGGTVSFLTPDQGATEVSGKPGALTYGARNLEAICVKATPAEGYYFEGWYDETGKKLSPSQRYTYFVGTSGQTLYARFRSCLYYQVIHYRVDSKGNIRGTEGENVPILGALGDKVTAVPKTYSGYTYQKGYSKGSEKEVLSGTLVEANTKSDPLLLKLYYVTASDSLSYQPNFEGATQSMRNTNGHTSETVKTAESAFTREGYTFKNRNMRSDGKGTAYEAGSDYTLTTGNDVLYAQWTPKDCTLHFEGNLEQGTVTMTDQEGSPVTQQIVKYDAKYGLLPTAESDSGYTFAGWYTEPVGGEAVTSDTKCTSLSTTLYAHWTKTITIGDHVKLIHSYIPEGQTNYRVPESKPESITVYLYRKLRGTDDDSYILFDQKTVAVQGTTTETASGGQSLVVSDGDYLFTVTDSSSDYEYRVDTSLSNYDIVSPEETGDAYPYKGIRDSESGCDFTLQYNPNNFPAEWRVEYVTSGEGAVPSDKQVIDSANVKVMYALTREGEYKDIVQHQSLSIATDLVDKTEGTGNYPVWKYQSDAAKSTYYHKVRVASYTIGGKEVKPEDSLYQADFDENTIMYYDAANDQPSTTMVLRISYRGIPVTFDLNNEKADAGSCPGSYDVVPGKTIERPADPTARHYRFLGWYQDPEGTTPWNFAGDTVTEATTLYGKWEKNKYTDTVLAMTAATAGYEENNAGGYVTVSVNSQAESSGCRYTVEAEKNVTLTGNVNKGYTFEGWYERTESGFSRLSGNVSFTYSVTENRTIYALFSPKTDTQYVIRHYKLSKDGETETCAKEIIKTGTTGVRTPDADPMVIPGYQYVSGYDQNGKREILNGIIDGAGQLVLKLYYTPNQDALFYDPNGQDVSRSTAGTPGVTDEYVAVRENGYTRTGYAFSGWNTESDGSGSAYQPGGSYQLRDGTDILYAQWTARKYKIRFLPNLDGKTVTIQNSRGESLTEQEISYAGTYGELPTAAVSGDPSYRFDGWYTKAVGGSPVTAETVHRQTEVVTVYAHWSYDFHLRGKVTLCHGEQHEITRADEVTVEVYRSPAGENQYVHVESLDQRLQLEQPAEGSTDSVKDYDITIPGNSDYEYMVMCTVPNYNMTVPTADNLEAKYRKLKETTEQLDFTFTYHPGEFPIT